MKKFLSYILILVIVVGVFAPKFTVNAATSTGASGFPVPSSGAETVAGSNGAGITPSNAVSNTVGAFLGAIFYGILKLMSWILWLAGVVLNFVLNYTIVNMKLHVIGDGTSAYPGMVGINIAWKVIRDIMNIAFIFLLVYEGILLIIGESDTTKVKKFITYIVLAALLINFSLFFTKIMIDASNVVTIGFYNSIIGPNPSDSYGLSDPITKELGLSSLEKGSAPDLFSGKDVGQVLVAGFGAAAIILVASFVFFAVAIMFIIRYIVLIILMMLSPVAYMGYALPFMSSFSKRWWSSFRSQVLFAPIYMVLTWVVLILMSSNGFITTNIATSPTGFNDLLNTSAQPSSDTVGLIVNFAMIIGLLIASLVIAKETASQGDKLIGQATSKLTAFAGGAIVGASSKIGRNTVGRAGNAISNSEYLKDKEVTGNFVTRNLARYTRASGTVAATSTFDARATGAYDALAGATGVKLGKAADAKKVNFRKDLENKAKNEAEYAKSLKPTDDAMRNREAEQKNLDAAQNAAKKKFDDSNKEIRDNQDRIKQLRENMNKASFDERESIKNEVESLEKETKDKQLALKSLREASEKSSQASKNFKEETEGIFKKRVEGYANLFNETAPVRYAKNAFKIPANLVSGVRPSSRGDNREIARKIRAVLKGKSADEELKDLLKKKSKEAKDKGEKYIEEEEETPPPTPTPEPTPTPDSGTTT